MAFLMFLFELHQTHQTTVLHLHWNGKGTIRLEWDEEQAESEDAEIENTI